MEMEIVSQRIFVEMQGPHILFYTYLFSCKKILSELLAFPCLYFLKSPCSFSLIHFQMDRPKIKMNNSVYTETKENKYTTNKYIQKTQHSPCNCNLFNTNCLSWKKCYCGDAKSLHFAD